MYVDVDLLYALIKENDRHRETAEKVLGGKSKLCTSAVGLLELEILIKREMSDFLSLHVDELVRQKFPKLKVIPFSEKLFKESLALRQRHGLGIFDSIHAATALAVRHKIASTDHVFDRVPLLERMSL